MARIRSVHPSLWTDDDYVSLSVLARLFLIGLWTEADDFGLFPWKPTRLKMRIFPADDVDPRALMEELVSARFIVRIERGGEPIGVIKKFRKFQRPQRPTPSAYPVDQEIARIICIDKPEDFPPAQPSVREDSMSPHGNPVAMEDGMVNRKGSSDANASGADAPPVVTVAEQIWAIGPSFLERSGVKNARSLIGKWRKGRGDEETLLAINAAAQQGVSDPAAWIEARLKNGGNDGQQGRGSDPRGASKWRTATDARRAGIVDALADLEGRALAD